MKLTRLTPGEVARAEAIIILLAPQGVSQAVADEFFSRLGVIINEARTDGRQERRLHTDIVEEEATVRALAEGAHRVAVAGEAAIEATSGRDITQAGAEQIHAVLTAADEATPDGDTRFTCTTCRREVMMWQITDMLYEGALIPIQRGQRITCLWCHDKEIA